MTYKYKEIVNDLLIWYDNNKRILPWRDIGNPYYIWVSEIMLQQTRVEAVKDYYTKFIHTLPTIKDLALVEEEQLLKLWEGLGYYNRVRNMQKAARVICEKYQNELPDDFNELIKLPGIGTYTAGAIASMAFGQKVPAVDGNVLRIAMRLEASYEDIANSNTTKRVTEELKNIIPNRAGDFNQALMDLGSMICIPKGQAKCESCPISKKCLAYRNSLVDDLPVKSAKSKRKVEEKTVLLIECNGEYLIRKRENKGLLANLWELPNIEGHIQNDRLNQMFPEEKICIESLGNAKHIFSHIEWKMIGYFIKINQHSKLPMELQQGGIWVKIQDIKEIYAIPNAFTAFIPKNESQRF